MGYKSNSLGFRLGWFRGWNSVWHADSKLEFQNLLFNDWLIHQYVYAISRASKMASGLPLIKRWSDGISRIYVGFYNPPTKKVLDVATTPMFQWGVRKIIRDKNVQCVLKKNQYRGSGFFFVFSITSALLVARYIAFELEKRIPVSEIFQDVMDWVWATPVLGGIHISCSGRFVGEDRARTLWKKHGKMPYSSMEACLDYAETHALTVYGSVGIKVWLYFKK